MTHEEFAHLCLSIKKGNVDIPIPCCANCEHYKEIIPELIGYRCVHPRLVTNGKDAYLVLQPEDFCSRFEARKD